MSVSVIEGKVVEAPIKVRRKAFVRFAHIDFERSDGRTQKVVKALTTGEIADLITIGTEGRFYVFKAMDVGGVAGVRLADGTSHFAYPGNNLKAFGLVIPLSIAMVVVGILAKGALSLLGVALLCLGVVGFVLTRNSRAESQRLFDGDGAPSRPAASATPSLAE